MDQNMDALRGPLPFYRAIGTSPTFIKIANYRLTWPIPGGRRKGKILEITTGIRVFPQLDFLNKSA